MEGLSAKSVILNFVCQLIVFLYLLDNDTSWMILASSGIGVCIEFWKIGKAMHIEVNDRCFSVTHTIIIKSINDLGFTLVHAVLPLLLTLEVFGV
jgi:hypothetical protein